MRNSFFALLVILLSGCVGNVNVRLAPPQPTTTSLQESLAEVEIHDLRTPGAPDGRREAAFGVPMGEVAFKSDVAMIVKQTLEARLASILRSTGIQTRQQYLCELQEFGVKTNATPLYWDIVGSMSMVLKTEKKEFRLSGTHTERTYVWPGEAIIKRVMENALGQVSDQLTTALANEPPENLAGIVTPIPQRVPNIVAAIYKEPSVALPNIVIPQDKALIYFYRPQRIAASANDYKILVNGRRVMHLANGHRFPYLAAAGKITISAETIPNLLNIGLGLVLMGKLEIALDAKPGTVHFIEVGVDLAGGPELAPVAQEVALQKIQGTKLSSPDEDQ